MTASGKRLAILHSKRAQPGARHHMVMMIADFLTEMGVEIVHLHGTERFEPADAVFVHVDLSVVPEAYLSFAQRYPKQINAQARDIRKRAFADGLLESGDVYPAPVIVKSNLNYGGLPEQNERSLLERASQKVRGLLSGSTPTRVLAKEDYKIYPKLADVPAQYFDSDHIVQKLILEKRGEMNLLREYFFLGDCAFENIESSAEVIITEDDHVSCLPFAPHPRLLEIRKRLHLDYGKIDYVMTQSGPFVFDVNKTIGLGEFGNNGMFAQDVLDMLRAFAGEIRRMLHD